MTDSKGNHIKCARDGCGHNSRGSGKYCSDSCRAKASHARNYTKRSGVQFNPKPRDPVRRAERDRWRRLLNQMKAELTYEEAREAVRLRIAEKLVYRAQLV